MDLSRLLLCGSNLFNYLIILAIFLISDYPVAANPKSAQNQINPSVKLSKHKKLVVFSYDGFRFDYMTKTATPNLEALRDNGVTTAYQIPQFATFTFPNHQSLATGLNTQTHGITANAVWDPLHGKALSGYENQVDFWKFNEDIKPLWILNEWAGDGRVSGVQFPGSDHAFGENQTTATYSLPYDGSRPFEARMDYVISWLTNDTHPANLIFMYFDEPDKQGHAFGPNSPQVLDAIKRMDDITGYFVNKLKELDIFDDVNLIFWSDHGMEEVNVENIIDFKSMVDPNLYYLYGGSPILQIWPKEEANTESIYEKFAEGAKGKNFTAYKKADLPERWKYGNNRRVAPIVLISNPGYIFNEKTWKVEAKRHFKRATTQTGVVGYHGYDNTSPNMRPYFIAHGPDFKKGFELPPFENVDLFPLICKLMGFEAPGNNGTLSRTEPMLANKLGNSGGSVKLTGPLFSSFATTAAVLAAHFQYFL